MKAAMDLLARWRERLVMRRPSEELRGPASGARDGRDAASSAEVPEPAGPLGRAASAGPSDSRRALLEVVHGVMSEVAPDTLVRRLVAAAAHLLEADAADCYLYEGDGRTLRCAAVHGLDPTLVGFELGADEVLATESVERGREEGAADADRSLLHPAYAAFAAAVAAPIGAKDRPRGVLRAARRRGKPTFAASDVDVLEAFARLASLALRNAEEFERASRHARAEHALHELTSVLGEPLSLAETLNELAHAATETLAAAWAVVVVSGRESQLELAGSHGLPGPLASVLREEPHGGALASAVAARRMLAAPSVADDDRLPEDWRRAVAAAGCRSLLVIPVESPRAREGFAGAVIAFYVEQRTFTDDDLELAGRLADGVQGALARSELLEAERSSRSLAQHLARTGRLLATELEPAAVLDELVEQAPALLGVDACAVSLLDGDELVVRAAQGAGAHAALGERRPSTAFLDGDVVHSRAPVAVGCIGADRRISEADSSLVGHYEAYLGVPLIGPEQGLHGVLSVYAKRARTWGDEEIEALVALASNASAVLSNAELYQRVALERERSLAILANIADGIVAVDREGTVVLWNAAAERITGVPAAEALGRNAGQVLHRELAQDGELRPANRLVAIRRGADEVWLSLTEAVMRDPVGEIAGRIFAFRDISAERAVDEMKSQFVSAVSQELRSPLTSIYGFAATLLREDVEFERAEQQTFLGYIASESERLTQIVDALLNVARLDAGDLQVELAPTDVRALVSEIVGRFETAPAGKGGRFVVELPEGPLEAEADAAKLRVVLTNLLDNAVRYSPEGGRVTVSARRSGEAVELRVADEGIGIPTTEQERIFAKFYRPRRAEAAAGEARGGTGLGLFIAQGLLAAMGGRISVTSAEGRGSAFAFELPLVRRERAAALRD